MWLGLNNLRCLQKTGGADKADFWNRNDIFKMRLATLQWTGQKEVKNEAASKEFLLFFDLELFLSLPTKFMDVCR